MDLKRPAFPVIFLLAGTILTLSPNCGFAQAIVLDSDLIGSSWTGTERLGGYGNIAFRFPAIGKAIMTDRDGDTNGTWSRVGDVVTLRFGTSIVYTGTITEKVMRGTGTNGPKTWAFSVFNPNALAGSAWIGTESLSNYGSLTFQMNRDGAANMIDKDGTTKGSWRRNGDNVTLQFGSTLFYYGVIRDNIMVGTAKNTQNANANWTFTVSNFNEIVRFGRDLLEKGEYDQAIRGYNAAIQVNPKSAALYGWRAEVYLRQKEIDKALADCDTAIKYNDKLSNAYNMRGLILQAQGDFDRCMKDHDKAISLTPNDSILYVNRGLAQYGKNNYDAAIIDFSAAIKMKSDAANYFAYRGNAFLLKKAYEQAVDDYSAAIRLRPDSADYQNYRATAYFRATRYDEAIADATAALKLNENFSPAYNNRGASYYFKKDYPAAIRDCTNAIRLDPKIDRAYFWRSQAYMKTGQSALGKIDYEKSITLNPANQQIRLDVEFSGKAVAKVANRQEAIRALRSYDLGNLLPQERLYQVNKFPQLQAPDRIVTPLEQETRDLLKNEKIRFDAVELDMVAAANKFLQAAKMSPASRQAEKLELNWLYGAVTPVIDRLKSKDDLGGMRLIGRLLFKDNREITAIFPITYYPGVGENRRGQAGVLWGADNFRLIVKLYSTGEVRKDYALQSFSVSNRDDGTQDMKPGYNLDENTGLLIDPYIRQSSLGTRCFDCHPKGSNLNLKGDGYFYSLMKKAEYKKMEGFEGFLKLASELGATRSERAELEEAMLKDPSILIPVDELLRANEEYWIRRYDDFKKKISAGSKK